MRIAFVGDSLTTGLPGSSYLAILRTKWPNCTLVNLGRGNDTVVSLYRRIARLRFDQPFDLAFLLVGINDISDHNPWSFRFINALLQQPPAKNLPEFQTYYGLTLDLLCRHANWVIAVSPLLKGEDVASELNRRAEQLSVVIQELATQRAAVEYLDVRSAFVRQLTGRRASNYLPSSVLRVVLNVLLTLQGDEQIDRKAAERGLYLTLDGIHLNSRGAALVAEALGRVINLNGQVLP